MTHFLARPNKNYLYCYLKRSFIRLQDYTTDMPAKKKKGTKSKRPTFDPEIVTGAKEKKVEGLLIFEHCVSWSTYKRRAKQLIGGVEKMFPNVKVEANASKPRRQSFNVTLNGNLLWDGKKMGPPRAKKFDILLGTKLHDVMLKAKK